MKNELLTLFFILSGTIAIFGQTAPSLFSKDIMEYKGNKKEQAGLLLRRVERWGKVKEKKATIDSAFLNLLDMKINFDSNNLRNYLTSLKLTENEVGGNLGKSISAISVNGKLIKARYFVIHDASTPVFKNTFPDNINDTTWLYNKAKSWSKKITHAYLTRTGELKTVTDFSNGLRATKFELRILGKKSKGLFIHVELIQPRVYPPGTVVSAPIAPEPGFTLIQYQRLALLYICASLRKGEWLVPAYHVNIDEGLNDGHDDPQNFDLLSFTTEVLNLKSKLEEMN